LIFGRFLQEEIELTEGKKCQLLRFRSGNRISAKVSLDPSVVAHTHPVASCQVELVDEISPLLLIFRYMPCYNTQLYTLGVIGQRPSDAVDDHHETIDSIVDSFLNRLTRLGGKLWINLVKGVTAYIFENDETDRVLKPEFARSLGLW